MAREQSARHSVVSVVACVTSVIAAWNIARKVFFGVRPTTVDMSLTWNTARAAVCV